MIFAYKMMTEKVRMNVNEFLVTSNHTMRGHKYKLRKKKTTKFTSINAFSNRIVNDWNSLPSDIVSVATTNTFKNQLDD